MKLTKYSHACFVVEKDGSALVVDPGGWSGDYQPYDNVVGIVVTHEHPDHFDKDILTAIVARNPDVKIYAPSAVTDQLENFPVQAIESPGRQKIGGFTVEFVGGTHAQIHESLPPVDNWGVLIDGTLYYPGDSFAVPQTRVSVLAVPASAPWMKMSEAMDFLGQLQPQRAFPTHDAILSDAGKGPVDRLLGMAAEKVGTSYGRILPGDSIEL